MLLKRIVQQEDIMLVNIYAPDIGIPKYIKKILEDFKKEINNNTIFVGDFNTPLTIMYRSSRQKNNEDIEVLNDTLDQMDLIEI